MSELVTYACEENVALITMDDGKANAFSFEMIEQLNKALDQAEKDEAVVVLAGREGKFCAGFHLETMMAGGEGREKLLKEGFSVSYRLMNSSRPVIAACSGHALAMGGVLLLSCDYRVGAEGKFKLGLNEIAIGVDMPEYGVDLVKERVALPFQIPALANSVLYAPKQAVSAGFLDDVTEGDKLIAHAVALGKNVSQINMSSHAKAKRDLRRAFLAKYKDVYGA